MPDTKIHPHEPSKDCKFRKTDDGCYWCCSSCNYDDHTCGGCGDNVSHLGNNPDGSKHEGCLS